MNLASQIERALADESRARGGTVIPGLLLYCVALMYLVQGGMLLVSPEAAGATSIWLLARVLPTWAIGAMFISAAACAFWDEWWTALPQQAFLLIAMVSASIAIFEGAYLDGTVIPRAHIFLDQSVYVMLALAHPLKLLEKLEPVEPFHLGVEQDEVGAPPIPRPVEQRGKDQERGAEVHRQLTLAASTSL